MVRETDADTAQFLELVLDPALEGKGARALEQVERNISAAGTIISELTRRGFAVRLVTTPSVVLEAGSHVDAIGLLEYLALLDAQEARLADPPIGESFASVLIGPRAGTSGRAERIAVPPSSSGTGGDG